jgi:hypothetical protein
MNSATVSRSILLAALAFAAGAAQADVTLYKQPNFGGERLTLRGESGNLEGTPLYDAASSLVVHSGDWEFCSLPDFKGDCVTLRSGEYATLDQRLNHRIESARRVSANDDRRGGRGERMARGGSIELYNQPGFGGRSVEISRNTESLRRSGLDDRASSIVVNDGVWQLCSAPGYQGTCRVFTPGRYPRLEYGMDNQVSSARQVERGGRPWG